MYTQKVTAGKIAVPLFLTVKWLITLNDLFSWKFCKTRIMLQITSGIVQINQEAFLKMFFVSRNFEYPFNEKKALISVLMSLRDLIFLSVESLSCLLISSIFFSCIWNFCSTNSLKLLNSSDSWISIQILNFDAYQEQNIT